MYSCPPQTNNMSIEIKFERGSFDVLNYVVCVPTIEIKASQGQVITMVNAEDEHIHKNEQEKLPANVSNWTWVQRRFLGTGTDKSYTMYVG